MGLLDGLIRIVQGKPVFETPGDQSGARQQMPSAVPAPELSGSPVADVSGRKIIPEISVEQCSTHIDGPDMEIEVWIMNRSPVEIELDKFVVFGTTVQLDRFFRPGEARQMVFYKGKVLANSSYHTANLYYKQVHTGDYFCADFTIEYEYEPIGYYKVKRFTPVYPVKDI